MFRLTLLLLAVLTACLASHLGRPHENDRSPFSSDDFGSAPQSISEGNVESITAESEVTSVPAVSADGVTLSPRFFLPMGGGKGKGKGNFKVDTNFALETEFGGEIGG